MASFNEESMEVFSARKVVERRRKIRFIFPADLLRLAP